MAKPFNYVVARPWPQDPRRLNIYMYGGDVQQQGTMQQAQWLLAYVKQRAPGLPWAIYRVDFTPLDPDGVDALMRMSEAEVDAELLSMGIDPEVAAQKGEQAVADGIGKAYARGYVCGLCGKNTPHQHAPEEVTIFRNGMKRGRAVPDGVATTPGGKANG